MTTLFTHIKSLSGILDQNIEWLKGKDLATINSIENAWLSVRDGKIEDFGSMNNISVDASKYDEHINAEGKFIIPAWCDSHTHLVYAGSRELEFVDRIKGLPYEEIAKRGGGILNSAKRLQSASEDELFDTAWERLQEVKAFGTAAIEIKSGYGLNTESELKMLRVIKRLKENSDVLIKSNFLAAHAFPMEFKENHQGYVDIIINEMLPQVASEGLADYIDAFCEFGFFSVEETAQILEAGAKYGLKPKIHANQLNYSGGIQVGVKYNAISVDHLECVGEEELACLQNSNTIGTLLPSAAFFINLAYQPARKMIDAGLGLALASDYNPGTSPSGNMNFIASLACTQLKMLPEEAINACTINGAYAMELQGVCGSITRGKYANLILTKKIPSLAYIPYSFGNNCIERVFVKGN
ncbi:MAG: imidazolonepropionase [Sphingobacteriales bacterium]|nr:imidazolonepropionase [Sphingobacteriales bacterium]